MLVEKLKELVASFNAITQEEQGVELWQFRQGADEWQNLTDVENDDLKPFEQRGKYLKLLFADDVFILNSWSQVEAIQYEGELVLCVTSRLEDPSYEHKYETHIKKVKDECKKLFDAWIDNKDCQDEQEWVISAWREIEVSNLYDQTMDGIKIKFTAKRGV